MRQWIIALGFTALLQLPAAATELKPDVINAATFAGKLPSEDRINPLAVKVQVLLDRVRSTVGSGTMSRRHFGRSQKRTVFRPERFLPRRSGPSFSKPPAIQ